MVESSVGGDLCVIPEARHSGHTAFGTKEVELRLVEELILLLFKDAGYRPGARLWQPGLSLRAGDGSLLSLPRYRLDYAISGAVLMDLALEDRIDTDQASLILLDASPVGDSLLDPTLAEIAAGERRDARFWVENTMRHAEAIHDEALSRLVSRGVIERRDRRLVGDIRLRSYSMIDDKGGDEVRSRIMGVALSDEIPDPRDVMVVCLADACGIFDRLLFDAERERASARIADIRRLDLIGRVVTQAILDVQESVDSSLGRRTGRRSPQG